VSLVTRLTSEKRADPSFVIDFMLTYRSFTSPAQLLALLTNRYDSLPSRPPSLRLFEKYPSIHRLVLEVTRERFNISSPPGLLGQPLEEWRAKVQTPIRLRCATGLHGTHRCVCVCLSLSHLLTQSIQRGEDVGHELLPRL
jgi:hypothetical protein